LLPGVSRYPTGARRNAPASKSAFGHLLVVELHNRPTNTPLRFKTQHCA
jgi:hypothetical protein